MASHILCLVTIDDQDKAIEISRRLVEKQLVACVNIIPKITSVYLWKGEVCEDTERLLIMKTALEMYPKLEDTVKELHPYEVPEVIAFAIDKGLPEYLDWIVECVGPVDS
jgi:periplasmic divalent cation tolerance protein